VEELLVLAVAAIFLFPVVAGSWGQLLGLGLVALLPAAGFLVHAASRTDTVEQGFAIAFAVMAAVPALGGIATRAASLTARGRGHSRPASLWIEVLGFVGSVAVFLLLTVGL
jgi:hypothetical protein